MIVEPERQPPNMVSRSAPTPQSPAPISMTLEQPPLLVDLQQSETRQGIPSDNPPAYDCVAEQHSNYPYDKVKPQIPSSLDQSEPLIPYNYGGPAYGRQPTFTPSPTVYYYNNPVTGERITSLLPPTHPEMVCLQAGEHVPQTNYGILGILAAVFWFPLGIGLCLIDKKVKCSRCGITIDEGVCG